MNSAEQQKKVAEAIRNAENALIALRKSRDVMAGIMNADRSKQPEYADVYSALNRAIKEASAAKDTLTVI